jgi:hypothetical protein
MCAFEHRGWVVTLTEIRSVCADANRVRGSLLVLFPPNRGCRHSGTGFAW